MRNTLLTLTFSLLCICSYAQKDNSGLDSLRNQFEAETALEIENFEKFTEEARKEYERYEQQMRKEYFEFANSVKQVWGSDTIVDDTKNEWVEYGKDYKSRSIVNFENGEILVEVAFDDIEKCAQEEIDRRISKAVEKMLESRGSACPYSSKVDAGTPLTERPILEGLVDLSGYTFDESTQSAAAKQGKSRPTPPAPKVRSKELDLVQSDRSSINNKKVKEEKREGDTHNKRKETSAKQLEEAKKRARELRSAQEIADAVAKQTPKQSVTVKGNDNKQRTVVQVRMNLVTDNISKNAALYKDYVAKYSEKFQIEQPLIYAVMEQESCFNPEATSWVPAFGLMQLVPRSGGYDAYRYVYKKDWVPTKSYLYVPHQNIELGTAYLRILMNQFNGVSDPDCRRLCVIASYNTGAGNVSRAFTGNTNLKSAIPMINRYDYTQLYTHLTSKLSTEEARNYVSGVSKRREKYLKK